MIRSFYHKKETIMFKKSPAKKVLKEVEHKVLKALKKVGFR